MAIAEDGHTCSKCPRPDVAGGS